MSWRETQAEIRVLAEVGLARSLILDGIYGNGAGDNRRVVEALVDAELARVAAQPVKGELDALRELAKQCGNLLQQRDQRDQQHALRWLEQAYAVYREIVK